MYPRFLQIFLDQQLEGVPIHKNKFSALSHTKKIFGNTRRIGKGFSGKVTPLFLTMVAAHKELGDRLVRAATSASSLEGEQDSGNIDKTQSKATPNKSSSQRTNSGGGPRCQESMRDTTTQTRTRSCCTAATTVTTAATTKELTLAQALEALKTSKPKVRGIVIQDQEEPGKSSTTTTTISKQQLQNKGKAIMIEEP
nr:hypothetical protein [Tanacetum cinerariifolium]